MEDPRMSFAILGVQVARRGHVHGERTGCTLCIVEGHNIQTAGDGANAHVHDT